MSVVIAGGGQAGFQTAQSLRAEGYDDAITIVGEEVHLPYQRPPLSKEFLAGQFEIDRVTLRPETFYREHRVELMLGQRVARIERSERRLTLASGVHVDYDQLVLATGARPRRLAQRGVLYLRGREDAVEIKAKMESAASVAVIGGGFIGLEVAAAARILGKDVTVIEGQPRLMPRAVAPILSDFYFDLHTRHGARVNLHSMAPAEADVIVAGIGIEPNVELARDAGLQVSNGISVDDHLRTADPNIYAIGDCAEFFNPFANARVRLESVQNAVDQARCVARNIAGKNEVYRAVPWFWTDQFEAKLQMAGLSAGHDRSVLRGAVQSGKFSVFYFKHDALVAVDSMNRPADHLAARKMLAASARITPDQAGDESFDLKSLVK